MRLVDSFASVFRYMAEQDLSWPSIIAELIDNSFDAGATRVQIVFSGAGDDRFWRITDDGAGCDDVAKMLPLGSHYESGAPRQTIGMYGVGLKDAWASCGETIEIETVCKSGRRGYIKVSVDDVNDLTGPDPTYSDTDGPSGTSITLWLRRGRRQPQRDTWDRMEWLFTPALSQGNQITIQLAANKRKQTLKPVPLPPFAESVQDAFEIAGKPVSIVIGIVKDGYRMRNGPFWISYNHRIIRHSSIGARHSSNGSCNYGTMRMGGQIVLGKGWRLTKNKDNLSELSEELGDAIFVRIEHLLKKHEQLCEDVESAALKSELESMINDSITDAKKQRKGKRQPAINDTGAILPKNTGRRHRKFTKSQDGNASGDEKRRRRGFQIDWMEDDGPRIGEVDVLANVVRLNVCHQFIDDAKSQSNKPALYAVAVTLLAHALCNSDGNANKLLFEQGSFVDTYATVMKTMRGKMEGTNGDA